MLVPPSIYDLIQALIIIFLYIFSSPLAARGHGPPSQSAARAPHVDVDGIINVYVHERSSTRQPS